MADVRLPVRMGDSRISSARKKQKRLCRLIAITRCLLSGYFMIYDCMARGKAEGMELFLFVEFYPFSKAIVFEDTSGYLGRYVARICI